MSVESTFIADGKSLGLEGGELMRYIKERKDEFRREEMERQTPKREKNELTTEK